ncbi:MAG: hypothetical protein ACRDKL_08795 [Solirubrobacteraceae bacterium]
MSLRSLRSLRRSLFAACSALAISGALAFAAAPASAVELNTTTLATINGNAIGALTVGWNTLSSLQANGGNPLHTTAFASEITDPGSLTSTDVTAEITEWNRVTSANDDQTQVATAWDTVAAGSPATRSLDNYNFAQALATLTGDDEAYLEIPNLNMIANWDPTGFPGELYSIDGDVGVSSSGTVVALNAPVAYNVSFGVNSAASTGYVLPNGFSFTFPTGFGLNTALAGKFMPPSDEANPPASFVLGTATITSPFIYHFTDTPGGTPTSTDTEATVEVVGSVSAPALELYLGQGQYALGYFSGVSFPLTVTFGQDASGKWPRGGTAFTNASTVVPFSTIQLSFPARTSPLLAKSCTRLGTVNGSAIDAVGGLAQAAGDGNASITSQQITGAATVGTDECAASARAKIKGFVRFTRKHRRHHKQKKKSKVTLSVRLAGNGGTPFTAATIRLPGGFSYRGHKSVTHHFAATARKTITLKNLKLSKRESRTKARSVKLRYSVMYSENGGSFASTAGTAGARL